MVGSLTHNMKVVSMIEPTEYTKRLMEENPRLLKPFNKAGDLIEDARDLLDEANDETNRARATELLFEAAALVLRDPDMWDLKPYLDAEWTRIKITQIEEMIRKAKRLFLEGGEEKNAEATAIIDEARKILFADKEKQRYPNELVAAFLKLTETFQT